MKKAPDERGLEQKRRFLMAASSHATAFAFMCVNRNQERVPVGIGKFVSLHVGTVIKGAVEFKPIVVLRPEVFHVLEYDPLAVCAGFTLQLHLGHLATSQLGFDDVTGTADLNWSLLHFHLAPFKTVGFENHGSECVPLFLARRWIKGDHHPGSFLVRSPFVP